MSHEEIARSETQLLRKFKTRREESEITLEGMSERLQTEYGVTISPTVYAKVESGARKLKTAEIFAIADILSVNVNEFSPRQRQSQREFVEGMYKAELDKLEEEAIHFARNLNAARVQWSVSNDLRISSENPSTSIQARRKDVADFITDLLGHHPFGSEEYFADLGLDESLASELTAQFTDNMLIFPEGQVLSREKRDEALEGLIDALDAALPNLTLV